MARLIGNVDATGSLSTSLPTPVTNASAVSLYLPFDSNINDNSANSFTVTAVSSATISNTQAQFGSYSLSLNGSSQYLTVADNDAFNFGSDDFTVEVWVYPTTLQTCGIYSQWGSGSNRSFKITMTSSGAVEVNGSRDGSTGTHLDITASENLTVNNWHHIAAVCADSTVTLYINGKNTGSDGIGGSLYNSTNNIAIGANIAGVASNLFAGFIDDLRVTKGFALYTQNFVPPSQAVGASLSGGNETNSTTGFTSVYLPFDSSVTADGSPINHSITANGGVNISSTQAKFGSNSAAFDGSDDQLTFTYNTGQYFGTGDFTVECFVYISAYSSGYWPIIYLGGPGATGNYQPSFGLGFENSGGKLRSIVGGTYIDHTSVTINTGQWIHVAACRANGVYKTFINGQLHGSTADTSNVTAGSNNSAIGGANFGGGAGSFYGANGYIDDIRVLNGFAKYTAEFTPPTSAVTATVSQTRNDLAVLYMPFDDGLEDPVRNHPVTAYGDAAISATQAQFGGKSLSLDGTGDYLDIPDNSFHFGSDDFTVECWLYHSRDSQSSQATFLDFRNSSSNGFSLTIDTNGRLGVYSAHLGNVISASSSTEMSKNAWHHFAYCRSGTTGKIFVDGTELGSATDNSDYGNTSLRIGARYTGDTQYYVGYIDDILISKEAKYTSAFTAPSSASGGEVTSITTDSRTFSSVWNLNSAVVAQNFKAGTWPGPPSSTVTVQVFGAGGAGGAQNAGERGGNGGIVKASKDVAIGTVLKIVVGNGGVGWAQANTGLLQGNTSDPMRGGDIQADVNNQTGGQGGSGSGVFVTSVAHGNAQVIAGGGGGGAGNNSARGGDSHSGTGASDSLNGGNGTGNSSYRGQGATTSAGGSANGSGSGAGAALLGGNSGTSSSVAGGPYNSGGSGGGGYYGGSGAGHGNSASQQGGGGAGSGYVDSSWTRLSASGMTPKAGSSNANDNPADGADGAIIVTDGAGTTTYSTPGTYDHTVS